MCVCVNACTCLCICMHMGWTEVNIRSPFLNPSPSYFFHLFNYILFTYIVCACMRACKSWFCPSTAWVRGIGSRASGLVAKAF